ncbi:RluA family pseudouridine synthase [uncultured Porphyromonas sp.]|uniref:RluA family pseudouridine synthase n=1 Tax=uncultured Porphyromonas sp. TaxID=159274 RepID=UPI00260E1A81|nr:RluA family pseudouridine synthase [uncultured Porphyromonas sp.]
MPDLQILYEDNHLLIVNKPAGMLVQGDSTGDTPLSELVEHYLIDKYDKPGRAFVGVTHRIDRPTSGAVLFAKTSKALARLNAMFQRREIHKVYHAVVCGAFPQKAGEAKDLLYRNRKQNKSYVVREPHAEAKRAWLTYERLAVGDRYSLLAVTLHTGRHHQIRTQLSHMGYPIKGDLKYGAPRSNKDGGISLHARILSFEHPVSHEQIEVVAPYPEDDAIWSLLSHTK